MNTQYTPYSIWSRHHTRSEWSRSMHTVKARTDKEAQSKTRRMFAGAGFSSMSLVALPLGEDPNAKATGSQS